MKNDSECPNRTAARSGSILPVAAPSASRSGMREWSTPIQKIDGSNRSIYAAHCNPKTSVGICECTCQTALPGGPGEFKSAEIPLADLVVVEPNDLPLSIWRGNRARSYMCPQCTFSYSCCQIS